MLFNGAIVSVVTGLTGRELGEFMRELTADRSPAFHANIVRMGEADVVEWIGDSYSHWSGRVPLDDSYTPSL